MNAEQALCKLEAHFIRLLREVFIFESLYSDQEALELLKEHLNDLFSGIQRPLMDSIVLCLCRMLDPAESCGKDNITFYYLVTVMPREAGELRNRLDALCRDVKKLRELRNKIIGHSDLIAHGQSRIEYRGASQDEISTAVAKVSEILEFCSTVIRGPVVTYHCGAFSNGGPEALISILKDVR